MIYHIPSRATIVGSMKRLSANVSEITKSRLLQLKNDIQLLRPHHIIADPIPFLVCYIVLTLYVIIKPHKIYNSAKQEFYTNYGYQIEYENAQRAYEEAQHNNNNNNNGNNNNNYYNYYMYQQNYPKNCYWFQYKCKVKQYDYERNYQNYNNNNQNNNNNEQNDITLPNWYRFLGGTVQQDDRQREQQQQWNQNQDIYSETISKPLQIVYIWLNILFGGIVLYGIYTLVQKRSTISFHIVLVLYIQFIIMSILLLTQGVIKTDERDLEKSIYGFYGQQGILLVYTLFYYLLYCLIVIIALHIRTIVLYILERRRNSSIRNNNSLENNNISSIIKNLDNDTNTNTNHINNRIIVSEQPQQQQQQNQGSDYIRMDPFVSNTKATIV